MISRNECIKLILNECPDFLPRWEEYQDYWKDYRDEAKPGLCLEMSEFGYFVRDLIVDGKVSDIPKIFELIERLMIEGDDEVQTAVATCFIENLDHDAGWGTFDREYFHSLLGSESLAFVNAYNERMDEIAALREEQMRREYAALEEERLKRKQNRKR